MQERKDHPHPHEVEDEVQDGQAYLKDKRDHGQGNALDGMEADQRYPVIGRKHQKNNGRDDGEVGDGSSGVR